MSRGNPYSIYYVSFPADDGPDGKTCGHQHKLATQAFNCGGNSYRVTRKRDPGSKYDTIITMSRVDE